MLQKIQRAATRPESIRLLFVLIVLTLLLAGISRTVFAQEDTPVIPDYQGTIVDDAAGGFILMGPDRYWQEENSGYQGHMWWTKNNQQGIENTGRWNLRIEEPGPYQIAVYIPNEHATSHKAPYFVHHQGQVTQVNVDQGFNQNTWYTLGTFYFSGEGQEYLELSDETGEPDSQYDVAFDAVGYRKEDPGLEEVIADELWERVKAWLDEQATGLRAHLNEWLEAQKGQVLRQLGDSITGWINEQCTGLGAAMVLPGYALIMWRKRRKDA